MAKKIEQWTDNEGCNHDTEIEALHADFEMADTMVMTPDSIAAIDALHEYAHRGDKAADTQRDTGTALPEGAPPELDDWVKRWEWITARVTEADCEQLNEADDVRIGLNWFPVRYRGTLIVCLKTSDVGEVAFSFAELANVANEVSYNGR